MAQAASGPRRVNQVLLVLVVGMVLAWAGLPFLTQAPNRLLSGVGLHWGQGLGPQAWLAALPALPGLCLLRALWLRPARAEQLGVALAASLLLALLWVLAGTQARALQTAEAPLSRIAMGPAFWWLCAACVLVWMDALQRANLPLPWHALASSLAWLPALAVLASGALNELSLAKEYANRADVFTRALHTHGLIVLLALLPTLVLGLPLGAWAHRRPHAARPLLLGLGLVQTLPSIALFALLIAPLTWLGLPGVGLLPAILALVMYSLLPIVRSTATGLAAAPARVLEAAKAMGMSASQLFWKVRAPIALPLLLTGVRVCTVQCIGLTVVAALIGAGGMGALIFQGLLSTALDLVLLGTLPVVALALVVDTLFRVLIHHLNPPQALAP